MPESVKVLTVPWRVGRSIGRTIYPVVDDSQPIAIALGAESEARVVAEQIVAEHNEGQAELDRLRAAGDELVEAVESLLPASRVARTIGRYAKAEAALKSYREAVPEREEPHGGE